MLLKEALPSRSGGAVAFWFRLGDSMRRGTDPFISNGNNGNSMSLRNDSMDSHSSGKHEMSFGTLHEQNPWLRNWANARVPFLKSRTQKVQSSCPPAWIQVTVIPTLCAAALRWKAYVSGQKCW